MSSTSVLDRLFTPRTALYVNLGLVVTGSLLALLGVVDTVSGVIMVLLGFAGIAVAYYAR
ncbi:hypothetical protein [Natrononativus amylolyticus]|uniref:hypothetical protein n=1 Tax=Natrononativus amylolyticus TaxID=2963434 RepID=UPI0020CE1085|nr:hypothetical protein [Natrononativus amylolyticus]